LTCSFVQAIVEQPGFLYLTGIEPDCNASIPRVQRRYCKLYTQVENTHIYIR